MFILILKMSDMCSRRIYIIPFVLLLIGHIIFCASAGTKMMDEDRSVGTIRNDILHGKHDELDYFVENLDDKLLRLNVIYRTGCTVTPVMDHIYKYISVNEGTVKLDSMMKDLDVNRYSIKESVDFSKTNNDLSVTVGGKKHEIVDFSKPFVMIPDRIICTSEIIMGCNQRDKTREDYELILKVMDKESTIPYVYGCKDSVSNAAVYISFDSDSVIREKMVTDKGDVIDNLYRIEDIKPFTISLSIGEVKVGSRIESTSCSEKVDDNNGNNSILSRCKEIILLSMDTQYDTLVIDQKLYRRKY